jgi:LmbE family N-acetylglucosaminyl deacetylase
MGRRELKLFLSPHNDDETLFGAFTILRERPLVLIVTDSMRQASKGITAKERRYETMNALRILGGEPYFLGIPDARLDANNLAAGIDGFLATHGPFEHVFAPAIEVNGNVDHNLIAGVMFSIPTTRYLTYTTAGKSRSAHRVPFEKDWTLLKLQALACYKSQIAEPSTRDHFLREQYEYYA